MFLDLSDVPAALARVPRTAGFARPDQPAPAPTGTGLLGTTLNGRRQGRRWPVVLVAVVTSVVTAAATGGAVATVLGERRDNATPEQPSVSAAAAISWKPRVLSGQDPVTGVAAVATITPTTWGVHIGLSVSGAPPGTRCRLLVVPRAGAGEAAGAWTAPGETPGDVIRVYGSSSMRIDQIVSLEVLTSESTILLVMRD